MAIQWKLIIVSALIILAATFIWSGRYTISGQGHRVFCSGSVHGGSPRLHRRRMYGAARSLGRSQGRTDRADRAEGAEQAAMARHTRELAKFKVTPSCR